MQVQLVRIQLRVPEYGWTTQKVFHLLNALVCALRCGSFAFRPQMDALHPDVLRLVLYDLPGAAPTAAGPSSCPQAQRAVQPHTHMPEVAYSGSWRRIYACSAAAACMLEQQSLRV
jgi:hypothetical protein